MYKRILVPVDTADMALAKPAIAAACSLARGAGGSVRLVNVLPMTPVMLAEYVPPDFDAQQRSSAEEALATLAKETGSRPSTKYLLLRYSVRSKASRGEGLHSRIFLPQYIRM